MANTEQDVWVFRIVHQDTGKPAQGVPVTVLDKTGNPAGYWVSEADGTVTIPRRDVAKLRLRVGLRNEEPIELVTASLGEGPIDLAAPTWLPQAPSGASERAPREPGPTATPRPAEPHDVPGHVLYFQRLVMFAEGAPDAKHGPRDAVADFFALASDHAAPMRYGALVELEESWQSLGVQWGELLYSVSLTPGDEARLAVLDGRWRREAEARERPLQILARMVGSSMLGERTERMSSALRRRPLGVVDANHEAPSQAAIRTVRNTSPDRVVTFHFFEPLERFKVVVRTPRVRPVIFVPFRLPNLATPDVVRRFGYIFRRTLLDRSLQPDLERLLSSDDGWGADGAARSRLLDHIEANLLYYSTAIISAGDPAARYTALAKLRDPAGRPLTELVENTVLGRIGNAIALPLRSADRLPREWQEALATYTTRPPRVNEVFTVTIPHPGVWVTAQPHDPMQQREAGERNAAG